MRLTIEAIRSADSTRARIVALLRRAGRTVDELAAELDLTDNAVRAHLVALERDGLVRTEGTRRSPGPGKPPAVYRIESEAEALFSQAYAPVLAATLQALGERLTASDLRSLMRVVGARLAAALPHARGSLGARAAHGAAILESLGGVVDVERSAAGYRIEGRGCPLAEGVAANPDLCLAVERLLADVTGGAVRQRCEHAGRPSCCFEISTSRRP